MKTNKQPKKVEAPKLLNDHQPSNDEIATTAYFLWEERGRPEGGGLEDWLEAEQKLKATSLREVFAH